MSLTHLQIRAFRCFEQVELALSESSNVLLGPNASGKTSLVEAIHFFCLGRSFRANKLSTLIQHGQSGFRLAARVKDQGGVERFGRVSRFSNGDVEREIDHQRIRNLSEFGKLLPVHVVTHEGFLLFDGGPEYRRRFLDYGVFHVEHDFIKLWKAYRQIHSQRNHLLRSIHHYNKELASWDIELAQCADALDEQRNNFWSSYLGYVDKVSEVAGLQLNLEYLRGWKQDEDLLKLLEKGFESDKKLGYTKQGPHRFDIQVRLNEGLAKHYLSRGQQKLLYYTLLVAQIDMLYDKTGQKVFLAIDDFSAEVDSATQQTIVEMLKLIADKTQFFFTSLDESVLYRIKWLQDIKGEQRIFNIKDCCIQPYSTN